MKKITISTLLALGLFALSSSFVSCGKKNDCEKLAISLQKQCDNYKDKKKDECVKKFEKLMDKKEIKNPSEKELKSCKSFLSFMKMKDKTKNLKIPQKK